MHAILGLLIVAAALAALARLARSVPSPGRHPVAAPPPGEGDPTAPGHASGSWSSKPADTRGSEAPGISQGSASSSSQPKRGPEPTAASQASGRASSEPNGSEPTAAGQGSGCASSEPNGSEPTAASQASGGASSEHGGGSDATPPGQPAARSMVYAKRGPAAADATGGGRGAQVRMAAAESAFRAGPWPGLTARGAAVLLVCSGMLLGCELLLGMPRRAWPDLVLLAVLDMAPPVLGTCIVRAPGCASAVCGVYLLGRSLASLVQPDLELPPLLLPAAVACDLVVWLRRADLRRPSRRAWRRPERPRRVLTTWRVALGGAAFGGVLALVEPSFAVLLGSDPSGWSAGQVALAGGAAVLACAAAGAASCWALSSDAPRTALPRTTPAR